MVRFIENAQGMPRTIVDDAGNPIDLTRRSNAVDFRTATRSVMEQYRKRLREVDDDFTLTEQQKVQAKLGIAGEYRQTFNETVASARVALDQEEERLARLANPPRRRSRDAGELMARREIREEIQAMRSPEQIIEGYREAVEAGDVLAQEVYEQHGSDAIRDPARRQEFSDLAYEQQKHRAPASQKAAIEQLEGLVQEGEALRMAWAHQQHIVADEVRQAQDGRHLAITRDDVAGMQAANKGGRR